jgi:hypothetical protein
MLRTFLSAVIGAAALVCFASNSSAQAPTTTPAPAVEMVPSPQYTSWAKHKPGTVVTMKSDMTTAGMAMTMDMTQTLKEVNPDKAVVDVGVKLNMGGMNQESKQVNEIAAKVAKGHEVVPADFQGTSKQVGNEKLTVAGKSYDCTVYEIAGDSPQGKSTGKIWHTPEIPGGMAKMEMKVEGQMGATISMNVVSIQPK